MPLDTLQ
ncbi:hypothetical protein VCHENC02_2235, partial [Vibrio harveyi]